MRILLIEDDTVLGAAVRDQIAADGQSVDWLTRLDAAGSAVKSTPYDLILLDLMLPDGRGIGFLKGLRARGDVTPVIILTALDQVSDRIEGLNAGADDYLVKPFDLPELLARLRAVIRRHAGQANSSVQLGDVVVDTRAKQVTLHGKLVSLTAREYAIVEYLALHRGELVSRTRLYDHVFDENADTLSNVIDVHVFAIRKKLRPDLIVTRRGLGYCIE